MKIHKGYKFRVDPSAAQRDLFARTAGCCRFVYNFGLAAKRAAYEKGERLSTTATTNLLPGMERHDETAWLGEVPSHCLQQALRDLDTAYKNLFEDLAKAKAGQLSFEDVRRPRIRRKFVHDSFRFPDPRQIKIRSGRILLPKIGWVRFRKSRPVEGTIKSVTVSRRGGHWYASILTEQTGPDPVHPAPDKAVGIDMGVARFATLSDGTFVWPLSSFRKLQKRLAREQRKLSRKVEFSRNWQKQKAKIAKIHAKIANARNDFLHKLSTTIAKSHGVVVLEDLPVKNMSASAKGTVEAPGRNVKAKSGLNRSILDQGWGEFRRQLEYKLAWLGGKLVLVDPRNTSRRCFECGHVDPENRKNSKFVCRACGHRAHADENAAYNILAAGLVVSACGEEALATSVKQESIGEANLSPGNTPVATT